MMVSMAINVCCREIAALFRRDIHRHYGSLAK
jgi:hypothetical protein